MRVRDFSISTTTTTPSTNAAKQRYKQLEFKYLYFRIQSLINKRVTLSLKFSQLRSPDIHTNLVKPISEKIIKLSNNKNIARRLNKVVHYIPVHQTPRFDPYCKNQEDESDIATCLIFILLLLKYEYIVQSENNLILYELLMTKADLCELLAIRMLKVYNKFERINMLFETPLLNDLFKPDQRYSFNTLELTVLSKSKNFLSQPIIVRTMDMFYNGELILKANKPEKETEELLGESFDFENYNFNKITLNKVMHRANVVPKYQSLVLNLKVIGFMFLYLAMILHPIDTPSNLFLSIVECMFWIVGLNFNVEFIMKILNIEFVFFKKMIWNHMDALLIVLINISFVLRLIRQEYFRDAFSLISIILIPRSLSVFNNYQFFNLITLSLKKMLWNLMGLCCLFFSLISGFYFAFVTLSKNASNQDVMFDMVKIFFGFTPSVWNNWPNYNTLGKGILMAYLFLIQFIIGSMLAIVLSRVFSKINENNHEEFNYIKTVNIIILFKSSSNFENCHKHGNKTKVYTGIYWINYKVMFMLIRFLKVFKIPIVLAIFVYEMLVSSFYNKKENLKHFAIFNKEDDFIQDKELAQVKMSTKQSNVFRQASLFTPSNDFGMLELGFDDLVFDDAGLDDENDIDVNDDISVLETKNFRVKQGRRYSHLDSNIRRVTKNSRIFGQNSRSTLRINLNSTAEPFQPQSFATVSETMPHAQLPKDTLEKVITNNSEHPRSDSTIIGSAKKRKNDEIAERLKRIEDILSHISPHINVSDTSHVTCDTDGEADLEAPVKMYYTEDDENESVNSDCDETHKWEN